MTVAKYNQETFIEAVKEVHGDNYDYSKVIYKALRNKIEVICPKHGEFWIVADKHLNRKQVCLQCSIESGNFTPPYTKETFVEKSNEVHSNKYDYSLVEYKDNKTKVIIICPMHGEFLQKPNNHTMGSGCRECSNDMTSSRFRSNTFDFIVAANLKHDNLYDYTKTEYELSTKNVEIICKGHGSFWQAPNNHLQGAGCPKCGKSGYNRNIPGTFYILKDADITKVGITNVATGKRLKQINTRAKRDFSILHTQYFEQEVDALNLETKVLRFLRDKYKNPEIAFEGSTECFFDVNLKELLELVSPLTQSELEQSSQPILAQ